MFARFFGGFSDEEQLDFLQKRVIITALALIISFIIALMGTPEFVGFGLMLTFLFVWGWGATKSLLGYATFGSLLAEVFFLG